MKKEKIVPLPSQFEQEHDETIHQIKDSLQKMDEMFEVYTPDLRWFEEQVQLQKEMARKKWVREITIFSIVACLILSTVLFTLVAMPIMFGILQVATSLLIIGYFAYTNIKERVNES
ncbi:YxlC family protein [Peribacillus alkalitolerans]|uniref:YxlC family protein n=1 Tax=Peribacillus alkalitolerans TaxID=1550385 RepID=UPI0013D22AD8|nr:YxlC family protein [Peribacillus alkalitolerans]